MWLRVGLLKRRGYLFQTHENPGCLGVRLSCFGPSMYVLYVCSGRVASRRGDACAESKICRREGNTVQDVGTERERDGRWMCEWMDGWFRVGLCSACEGKCSTVKEDEGMDGMGLGWDGTAGRASGTVRCGLWLP